MHQRLALSAKGAAPDTLGHDRDADPAHARPLLFRRHGCLALTEKPAGRQPIDTRAVPLTRINEVVERIGGAIEAGDKAYWVCPLVEESEDSDLEAAESRFAKLAQSFGPRVGLVHGRMKPSEKDSVMERFRAGDISILVATTVIEVGVDVTDATIMVIEHAERFGLAQLHQLRGRVGRGAKRSVCLLLYRAPLGETAKARLSDHARDGGRLSHRRGGSRLRGEGDVLGTRQSGMPGFRIALPEVHSELLEVARDEAKLALARDPDFTSERAEALRLLLYLFGRDEAVRLMRAG